MELRQKAARLVMSSISNREWDDLSEQYHRLRREVLELGVGGYTIFGGNVDSTFELVHELAEEAPQPLLVSSDLERGLGQQLDGGTVFPTQMALGAAGVTDLSFAQGWATAREALAAGIDVVFSPVADVASEPRNPIIGIRSFGGDAAAVSEMTASFVRGCQQAGAAATAKHFPGHGDTSLDSHIELPTVAADMVILDERELPPFRAAIESGVRMIMTAHVAYPAVTGSDVPATLSKVILTDLLRDRMGYEGVVVTDAMLMGAITARYGCGEAAVMAVEAGADVVLMPPDVEEAIEALHGAVMEGRLPEARLDESLARLDALHKWLGDYRDVEENHVEFPPEIIGAFEGMPESQDNHRVEGCGDNEAAANHIARRAATLLRDPDGVLPLASGADAAAVTEVFALKDSDRPVNLVWFRSQVEARLADKDIVSVDETAGGEELARLEALASSADVCIIAVFDDVVAWKGRAGPSEELLEVARRLMDAADVPVVVAFTGPELALSLPDAGALVCCYDACTPSQLAASECLFGEIPFRGRLPVALPPAFEIGSGLV